MKRKILLVATFLSALASVWIFNTLPVQAGPDEGRGRQYWVCRWKIGCDNSSPYGCGTGGLCGANQ